MKFSFAARIPMKEAVKTRAAILIAPLIGVFLFVSAGAASGVGVLEVSDATPTPGSEITMTSTGWAPGHDVIVGLSGSNHVLARVAADATGAVRTSVIVPKDATLDVSILSVVGTAASGVPQQIVTPLTIHRLGPPPAPARPWTAVFLLAAFAAMLLIISLITPGRPARRFAPESRLAA